VLIDLRSALHRFNEAQGFLLAAALSFSFLLCLAPLVLLFFSGTGFLLASDQAAGSVIQVATSLLPGYSAEILGILDLLNRERRVTGTLGVIGLAIFATPLFALTRTAMNAAFRVQRGRGLVHGFAFDLGALAAVGLLAIALASALLLLATLSDIAASAGIPTSVLSSVWVRAVAPALLYVALLGLLFFVYRTFPNTGVSTRAAMTGTLIVATLWEIARLAFASYLTSYGTYGKLYGSFGVVAATLAWIYYSATIFVFGGGLTAVLSERYGGRAPEPPVAVGPDPAAPAEPRWRLAAYLLSAGLGAALVLFAAQNAAPVTLHLFAWVLADVPLAALVLGALAAGALAAGVPLWIAHALLRSKVRAIESRRPPPEPNGPGR
jgi:membrane protein